jgi:hypothetical protein
MSIHAVPATVCDGGHRVKRQSEANPEGVRAWGHSSLADFKLHLSHFRGSDEVQVRFVKILCKIGQTAGPTSFNNTVMLTGDLIETQALTVRCPTCGAGPTTRCERVIGGVRPQSHLERRLIASDKVARKMTHPGGKESTPRN